MVSVIASKEEIAKAEVEAWHKTHYRADWLLSRTLGYALLSSTLAIYVFWAEAGHSEHPIGMLLSLSLTWVILLGLGMLWYDFHTRVSYENWPEVRRRLSRHLFVSLLSFVGAIVAANAIHGVFVVVDRMNTPPDTFDGKKNVAATSNIAVKPIKWHKGMKPVDRTPGANATAKKTPDKKAPDKKTSAPVKDAATPAKTAKPVSTTTVAKPAAKVPPKAKPAVKPLASKPAAKKPVAKKPLVKKPHDGDRMQYQGKSFRYYGGRWHRLRRQRR